MQSEHHILFIIDHLKGGGAEQITLDVANNLAKRYQVTVALMDSTDIKMSIHPDLHIVELDIHNTFMSGSLWRRHNRSLTLQEKQKINQLIEKLQPNLIILSHWYALHLLPEVKGNVWAWVHGEIFNPDKKPTKNLFRWYKEVRRLRYERKYFPKLFNAHNVIFVNKELAQRYQPYIPTANIITIHNGIDQVRLTKDLCISLEKKWDCIFVGRLSPEKQPDYAIKAFKNSKLKGRMAIVGDGLLKPQLQQLAQELELSDRIDFLGWQSQPAQFIAQSKILVMSSVSEGFGLVISEALLLNTPVVAFDCSYGVRYQLDSTELQQGLVPAQNLEALSEKMAYIAEHPYCISNIDQNRLCIEHVVQQFEQLLRP